MTKGLNQIILVGGNMKVISGIYKGKKIELPNKEITRPTMDRVKESLFATINNYLKDSVVLDLFGGSGALSFEALSNGAKYAYIVDNNSEVIKVINKNINNLNLECKVKLIKEDALKWLKKANIKVDIIFLDPPYDKDLLEKSLEIIRNTNILNNNGMIICEHEHIINCLDFNIIKQKKYGQKYITILNKNVD